MSDYPFDRLKKPSTKIHKIAAITICEKLRKIRAGTGEGILTCKFCLGKANALAFSKCIKCVDEIGI